MKRILLCIIDLLLGFLRKAQVYNNEWIDYNKTYYKFKVGATGLVPYYSANTCFNRTWELLLQNNFNFGETGKQIPIYTSVPTGPLGGS